MADLWWWMLALGVAVFVVFAAALGLALWRRRSQDESEAGAGNPRSGRWIVWGGVVMPVLVLALVFGLTIRAMTATPGEVPPDALAVEVVGHQWWYEVRYPESGVVTANELHLPVDRPVALTLTSADVIHSFWVPELGGKMDLLPERPNTMVLEAGQPGEYLSRCAEFCGIQHTKMVMQVVAEPAGDFEAWVADRSRAPEPPAGGPAAQGLEVFAGAGCASCHAIEGTDAAGTSGPDLTHLASRSTLGAGTVPNTGDRLREWITDPHAVKEGVKMPGSELDDEQMDALLAYLATLR
jgi:cytochrome c oxidase subunit II